MNSTLCRREPWPFGYAHMEKELPGMDSNHHVACFRGRWATDYPTRQRKSRRGRIRTSDRAVPNRSL